MKIMLAENIRAFRKERLLTQERLSEAPGVTAGAVYKREAKRSIPEFELIIQLASFFDTIMLPARRSWAGGPSFCSGCGKRTSRTASAE